MPMFTIILANFLEYVTTPNLQSQYTALNAGGQFHL